MNITIVGPGAIGSLWAVKLSQAGHTVSLWSRNDSPSLQLSFTDSETQPHSEPNHFLNGNIEALQSSDLILITVKAWQVEAAIQPLLAHLHPDTMLVFMHNGMGALDPLQTQLETFPVIIATTTQAAYKPDPSHVQHTGKGETQLGAFNEIGSRCSFLQDVFHHALAKTSWNSDIETALWTKLAINCAINPLTAIHQCKNGELANASFSQSLNLILDEIIEVLTAVGVNTNNLIQTVHQIILATRDNYSSMQQDVFHGRKTEIDAITGHLINTARQLGIATPHNDALFHQIKQIENSENH